MLHKQQLPYLYKLKIVEPSDRANELARLIEQQNSALARAVEIESEETNILYLEKLKRRELKALRSQLEQLGVEEFLLTNSRTGVEVFRPALLAPKFSREFWGGLVTIVSVLLVGSVLFSAAFWGTFFARTAKVSTTPIAPVHTSDPYLRGKIRYLTRIRAEYESASPDQRNALRSLILYEAADVDRATLPADIQQFLEAIENEK